jgi:transcriptional regulator with XRE-family HTH domain
MRIDPTITPEVRAWPQGQVYDRAVVELATSSRVTQVAPPSSRVGPLLRDWRQRRRLSQFELALQADVSARHISFIETGRSRPSARMVLHLAANLDIPLRERNQLLLAAGYAPVYGQRGLDDPEMGPVHDTLELILHGHEPYPAMLVDRHWGIVSANRAFTLLTEGAAPELLEPPANVLRLALHPDGVAPRIVNFAQLRATLLLWLARQAISTGDPALAALHQELSELPGGEPSPSEPTSDEVAVPLRIRSGDSVLSFLSTITTFARATDITLAELSIESFYPTDLTTANALRAYASRQRHHG